MTTSIGLIEYGDKIYPSFQAEGNAAQFAIPYAKHFCRGKGYDIGCNRIEWSFPGSIPIDEEFGNEWNAFNLPEEKVDYIFSSHCLEHIDDWVGALEYWTSKLNILGSLFLYLPHYDQEYWRPWNNRKHKHVFTPTIMKDCLEKFGYKKIFCSERDLNHSFMIVGEKQYE